LPKCNLAGIADCQCGRRAVSTRPENAAAIAWTTRGAVQARSPTLSTLRRSADTFWAVLLAPASAVAVAVPLDGAVSPQRRAAGAEAPQRGAAAGAERHAPVVAEAAGPALPP